MERREGGDGNWGGPPRPGGLRTIAGASRPITGLRREVVGCWVGVGGRRRPYYRLSRADNRTAGEGRAAAWFMRHAQGRAGECHSWLGPPGRTKSEICSERSTGRPRPTPDVGSTRSMTSSIAGTFWSGRGSWCAPTEARPTSTGHRRRMLRAVATRDRSACWRGRCCGTPA